MELELILVTTENLPKIAELAYKIWQIHYPPIVGQAQVNYMLDRFYDLESLGKQLEEGQIFYLINKDDIAVGFIAISKKQEGQYFIHKFYIDTNEQSKGTGEKVFEMIKNKFRDSESLTFNLTVNRQNYKAINFYFKIGFKISEVADFDIGNGYLMNDFVMTCKS